MNFEKLAPQARPAGPLDDVRAALNEARELVDAVEKLAERLVGPSSAPMEVLPPPAASGLIYQMASDARGTYECIRAAKSRIGEVIGVLS